MTTVCFSVALGYALPARTVAPTRIAAPVLPARNIAPLLPPLSSPRNVAAPANVAPEVGPGPWTKFAMTRCAIAATPVLPARTAAPKMGLPALAPLCLSARPFTKVSSAGEGGE